VAACLFATVCLSLQAWRIWSLNATYDQGLFLQEIWNGHLGRAFEASPLSTPVLVSGDERPRLGYQHLDQHFTPLLMLWLPVLLLGAWSLHLIRWACSPPEGWCWFSWPGRISNHASRPGSASATTPPGL
jgi:uncharacterized membrane protein